MMIGNLIQETTTSTGTGNLVLTPRLRSFSSARGTGSGNTFYYCIFNDDASEREVGIGYMSDSTTLVRVTPVETSNSNALVDFSAGVKTVVCDVPANLQQPGMIALNEVSADYTVTAVDSGKCISHAAADTTGRTITLPDNSTLPLPVGTAITFHVQDGAGNLTIETESSDTIRLAVSGDTGARTLAENGIATAIKISGTEWLISGAGLT
jgi:hypothetical protein